MILTNEELQNMTLLEIERLLESNIKSLSDYPTMPNPDISLQSESHNKLIYDELNYDRATLAIEHNHLLSQMTSEQRRIYDRIMGSVDNNRGGMFFMHGYGGTGKTFIWRTVAAAIRSK